MLSAMGRYMHFYPRRGIPLSVLAILPGWIPSCLLTVVKPLNKLGARGLVTFEAVLESEAIPDEAFHSRDIIVFCRNGEPFFKRHLDKAVRLGKIIIYELDDNFWELPADCELGGYYKSPEVIGQLETYIAYADLVRVYSPPLLEKCLRMNRNVKIAKAGVDFNVISKSKKNDKDRVGIVYATGRGREDKSFELCGQALRKVLAKHNGRVEMVFWGATPEGFSGIEGVREYGFMADYDAFLRKFSEEGFDIGLAPLENSRFAESKSNNKFREYGACQIAGIYSNVSTYSTSVTHGVTGLLVEQSSDAWFEAMENLVTDEGLRNEIKEKAYRYVFDNYRFELIEDEWLKDSKSLHGRRLRSLKFSTTSHNDGLSRVALFFEGGVSGIQLKIKRGEVCLRFAAVGEYRQRGPKTELAFSFEPIRNSRGKEFIFEITYYAMNMGFVLKKPHKISQDRERLEAVF